MSAGEPWGRQSPDWRFVLLYRRQSGDWRSQDIDSEVAASYFFERISLNQDTTRTRCEVITLADNNKGQIRPASPSGRIARRLEPDDGDTTQFTLTEVS